VLPTVNGTTDYLLEAPGWSDTVVNPTDIGIYVPMFDQGSVDVGNGSGDASWVHDDVQAAAIALDNNGERAIVVTVDVYMIFSVDGDEIARRQRSNCLKIGRRSQSWSTPLIIITAQIRRFRLMMSGIRIWLMLSLGSLLRLLPTFSRQQQRPFLVSIGSA